MTGTHVVASDLKHAINIADAHRQASQWQKAIPLYLQALQVTPQSAVIKHNLALCYFAIQKFDEASRLSLEVTLMEPTLWQAKILLAKCHKLLKRPLQAAEQFKLVLSQDYSNGEARLGLADLALNEFGDPLAAINWVKPLSAHPQYADDAQLTTLMASLYDRDESASMLNQKIITFSKAAIQLPASVCPRYQHAPSGQQVARRRIGIISPLFCVSPVYFLTIGFFKQLAIDCDLIFFNRGTQKDWATAIFEEHASEWFDVASLPAAGLAEFLYGQDLDVLYDLGGWMDPVALKALSVKPARKQFKWVGGQSVTTGLDCFDGWIGDHWQSPMAAQSLYTEPLIHLQDDYVEYTPPPYLPKPASNKSNTWAIFANPAKVSRAFLKALATIPGKKCFIHRQFQYDQVRARIESDLKSSEVEYRCPQTHLEALEIVNQHAVVLDTFPYTGGLTAREALALGCQIKVLAVGALFCERHTARYQS